MNYIFNAAAGANKVFSVTNTSQTGVVDLDPNSQFTYLRLVNSGEKLAFVRLTKSSAPEDATSADTPILPGGEAIIGKGAAIDSISCISESATTTLYCQPVRIPNA